MTPKPLPEPRFTADVDFSKRPEVAASLKRFLDSWICEEDAKTKAASGAK